VIVVRLCKYIHAQLAYSTPVYTQIHPKIHSEPHVRMFIAMVLVKEERVATICLSITRGMGSKGCWNTLGQLETMAACIL
jgi:hypothetical protein